MRNSQKIDEIECFYPKKLTKPKKFKLKIIFYLFSVPNRREKIQIVHLFLPENNFKKEKK